MIFTETLEALEQTVDLDSVGHEGSEGVGAFHVAGMAISID
jgi:hypothetical protein